MSSGVGVTATVCCCCSSDTSSELLFVLISLAWRGRVSGRLITEAVDLRSVCSHSQEITAMCSQRFINTHHRTTVLFSEPQHWSVLLIQTQRSVSSSIFLSWDLFNLSMILDTECSVLNHILFTCILRSRVFIHLKLSCQFRGLWFYCTFDFFFFLFFFQRFRFDVWIKGHPAKSFHATDFMILEFLTLTP